MPVSRITGHNFGSFVGAEKDNLELWMIRHNLVVVVDQLRREFAAVRTPMRGEVESVYFFAGSVLHRSRR